MTILSAYLFEARLHRSRIARIDFLRLREGSARNEDRDEDKTGRPRHGSLLLRPRLPRRGGRKNVAANGLTDEFVS
jgi:hypothetical protein